MSIEPRKPNHESKVYRVYTDYATHDWWQTLTADQRGEILKQAKETLNAEPAN